MNGGGGWGGLISPMKALGWSLSGFLGGGGGHKCVPLEGGAAILKGAIWPSLGKGGAVGPTEV